MSAVKKLESLLQRLENTKGGYLGLAKAKGGVKCKCPQCKYAKCRCGGGQLLGGQVENFSGSGLTGGAIEGFAGGRKKRGGRSCGAGGLTGGQIESFDGSGLTGGQIEGFAGSGLVGGRTPKGVTPPQLKAWLDHVRKVKAQHPNAPYKDVLKAAKASYKK